MKKRKSIFWLIVLLITIVWSVSTQTETPITVNSSLNPIYGSETYRETIPFIGHVSRVIDGDTFELTSGHRVRLIGIDTPEIDEPFYEEATVALSSLLVGKEVHLKQDVTVRDRYGRLLMYAYVSGVFINRVMVEEGWAEAKAYPPDTNAQEELEAAETSAKLARRGRWIMQR